MTNPSNPTPSTEGVISLGEEPFRRAAEAASQDLGKPSGESTLLHTEEPPDEWEVPLGVGAFKNAAKVARQDLGETSRGSIPLLTEGSPGPANSRVTKNPEGKASAAGEKKE